MPSDAAIRKKITRVRAREFIDNYLSTRSCDHCSNPDPRVLEFHHIDPKTKRSAVSTLISKGAPIRIIEEEVAKTTVLCGNCHKILHHEERRRKSGKESI